MWTTGNRARHDRGKLRYPSGLTEAEWALVEPLMPPAKHGGRDREADVREVVNGTMYGPPRYYGRPRFYAPRHYAPCYYVRRYYR